jgi:hypothetical protein
MGFLDAKWYVCRSSNNNSQPVLQYSVSYDIVLADRKAFRVLSTESQNTVLHRIRRAASPRRIASEVSGTFWYVMLGKASALDRRFSHYDSMTAIRN